MDPQAYDLLDTALKIGLGAVIAVAGTNWLEKLKQAEERRREMRRFRRARIVDPVITFVDANLALISYYYWWNTDLIVTDPSGKPGAPEGFQEKLTLLWHQEGPAQARVEVLGDRDLLAVFKELTLKMGTVRSAMKREGFGGAYDERNEAIAVGGRVISRLLEYATPK
jgi:hypothetical protein